MIDTIIVEDDESCAFTLKQLLNDHCKNINVIDTVRNVASAVDLITKKSPNLVFLDIKLDRENAFDILNQIKNINFELIFTTAFDGYAVKAFEFSALDYLLKPVTIDRLKKAIDKTQEKLTIKEFSSKNFDVFFENIKNANNIGLSKIIFPTFHGKIFVQLNNIIRFEADGKYTWVYSVNEDKKLISEPIKKYQDLLEEYNFFRVHKHHLINLKHIKEFIRNIGGYVIMSDESHISISKRKMESFLSQVSIII